MESSNLRKLDKINEEIFVLIFSAGVIDSDVLWQKEIIEGFNLRSDFFTDNKSATERAHEAFAAFEVRTGQAIEKGAIAPNTTIAKTIVANVVINPYPINSNLWKIVELVKKLCPETSQKDAWIEHSEILAECNKIGIAAADFSARSIANDLEEKKYPELSKRLAATVEKNQFGKVSKILKWAFFHE